MYHYILENGMINSRNRIDIVFENSKPDEKLDKKEALKVIPHKCQLNGPVLDHIQEKNMDLSSSSHHPPQLAIIPSFSALKLTKVFHGCCWE